ncbi:MAG TPA: hypothetical protein VI384_06285 [Candidatus Dormibacteraeota bacterium]
MSSALQHVDVGLDLRTHRSRFAFSIAAAWCAWLLTAAAGSAATPRLVVNPDHGPGGTVVSVTGTGFCASCGVVEIDFAATPLKRGVIVGADGSFSTTVTVPGGAQAGTDSINAYQQGVLVAQTAFNVTPSAPAPTGQPSPVPTRTATPSSTPKPISTPTASAGASQAPSPYTPPAIASTTPVAASHQDFPSGLVVALVLVLALAAAAIGVVAWRRRHD